MTAKVELEGLADELEQLLARVPNMFGRDVSAMCSQWLLSSAPTILAALRTPCVSPAIDNPASVSPAPVGNTQVAGLVERAANRINDAPLPTEYLIDEMLATVQSQATQIAEQDARIAELAGALRRIEFHRPAGDVDRCKNPRVIIKEIEQIARQALADHDAKGEG